jgi:hypothetical protein
VGFRLDPQLLYFRCEALAGSTVFLVQSIGFIAVSAAGDAGSKAPDFAL